MARPRTFIVTNDPSREFIENTSNQLHENTEQDVFIVDGSNLGQSDIVIQESGTSGGSGSDGMTSALTAAVVGGIGSTLGSAIVEQLFNENG